MHDSQQEAAGGHSLGGGGAPASPAEMRRRRLAALNGSPGGSSAALAPSNSTAHNAMDPPAARPPSFAAAALATTPPRTPPRKQVSISTDPPAMIGAAAAASSSGYDDEDAQLQAALALSLQELNHQNANSVHQHYNATDSAMMMETQEDEAAVEDDDNVLTAEQENDIVEKCHGSAEPYAEIVSFHKLMWDDSLTESDKSRWISQGIGVREDVPADSLMTDSQNSGDESNSNSNSNISSASMLQLLAESHRPWGLVQQHGGPCGVLAAAQAELLRLLIFSGKHGRIPTSPARCAKARRPLPMLPALARSLALLLARVTLTPCAVQEEETAKKDPDYSTSTHVRIVLPTRWIYTSTNTNNTDTSLTWQDLEPWYSQIPAASTSLTVFKLPVVAILENQNDNTSSTSEADPKRQKMNQQQEQHDSSTSSLTTRIHHFARLVEAFLLRNIPPNNTTDSVATAATASSPACLSPLDCFRRQGGVLLFVMSLVASRTVAVLRKEFDDPTGTHLTAQFGHCGQELINLLLTGQAVSNVFDNTLSPSGDMVCRGVQHRPAVGYLTQLEAMRYCEVGGYYKSPIFPIWVVGSTSHFTVLFGDAGALKESQSDRLLDECRRAFKAVERGEENGFIPTDKLRTVLQALDINLGGAESEQASRIQTLGASLEVSGANIILWDDFWKAASRLMTGATLETVLQGDEGSANPIVIGGGIDDDDDEPPPLLTNYAENDTATIRPTALGPGVETDEEMARRLGAEWGSYTAESGAGADSGGLNALSTVASAMDVDLPAENSNTMTDEEMARKLQEQFNAENSGGGGGISSASSVTAVRGSPIPFDSGASLGLNKVEEEEEEDAKPAAKPSSSPVASSSNMSFEQFGDSFLLHHYNGLRGGVLTQFRITRLSAEEAVGSSIALTRGGGSSHGGSGSQDLEDVVRTKWPSCTVNWLGKQPPYID